MNDYVNNVIIKEIKHITIKNNHNNMECYFKISANDSLNVSISTSETHTTDIIGNVKQVSCMGIRNLFCDGSEIVINGTFEDNETGCVFNGDCIIHL